MGEFFKGWRRKLGTVTLVLACLFLAGWVRSLAVADIARIRTGPCSLDHFVSSKFGLVWDRLMVAESDSPQLIAKCSNLQRYSQWYSKVGHKFESIFDLFSPFDVKWQFKLFGFHLGNGVPVPKQTYIYFSFVVIPYWSIVVPLSLLSAYLLLSKPRQSSPEIPSEPTPEMAARVIH